MSSANPPILLPYPTPVLDSQNTEIPGLSVFFVIVLERYCLPVSSRRQGTLPYPTLAAAVGSAENPAGEYHISKNVCMYAHCLNKNTRGWWRSKTFWKPR